MHGTSVASEEEDKRGTVVLSLVGMSAEQQRTRVQKGACSRRGRCSQVLGPGIQRGSLAGTAIVVAIELGMLQLSL